MRIQLVLASGGAAVRTSLVALLDTSAGLHPLSNITLLRTPSMGMTASVYAVSKAREMGDSMWTKSSSPPETV